MLQQRGNGMVARAQRAVNRHIERVRRVLGKGDARSIHFPQHFRDLLPAALHNPPGGQRQLMPRAPGIRPACRQRARHYARHARGFGKARRCIVQINHVHPRLPLALHTRRSAAYATSI